MDREPNRPRCVRRVGRSPRWLGPVDHRRARARARPRARTARRRRLPVQHRQLPPLDRRRLGWANRHVALPDEFARFAATAGVAGGVGFAVGGLLVLATAPIAMEGFVGTLVFGLGYNALTKSVSVGLYALAGAAVAHFRGSGRA